MKQQFIRVSDDPDEQKAALRTALRSDPDAELSLGNGHTGAVIIVHNDGAWMAVTMTVNPKAQSFKLED